MEIKELMIGDWVQVPSELDRYKHIRSTFDMDEAVLYQPILISKEILQKNGFEDVGDNIWQLDVTSFYFWYDFERYIIGCNKNTSTHEEESCMQILYLEGRTYVHELQHALRLCGSDKEIVL